MEQPVGLKRELHVSGYDVTVEFDDEVVTQGDAVTGTITVAVGADSPFGALSVRLQEFWPRTEADAKSGSLTTRTSRRTLQELDLKEFTPTRVVRRYANAFQIEDGRAYPFELQLPRNARISTERSGWQLVIAIATDEAVYPQAERVRLDVQLAEEVEAVRELWTSRLKFTEDVARRRWSPDRVSTTFWFEPPKALGEALDAVVLELQQDDSGGVVGSITFDRAERGIADYFKALLDQDKVTRTVELDAAELFTDGDEFRTDDVTRAFGNLLNRVLAEG